jgi:Hint domain
MSYPATGNSSDNQNSRRNVVAAGVLGAAAGLAAVVAGLLSNDSNQGGSGSCFLKGTTIRTADGDRKIEDLAVGDLLPTVFGGVCPIQWIGYYLYRRDDQAKPWVKNLLPVRIARSALGPDLPQADLYVSKEHGLLVDGLLVTAGSLINGKTITLYDARELSELKLFHIKLARHNVIYAEGAPCETLINLDERAVNFSEYFRRYGPPATQEARCAPLLSCTGSRREIKSRFRSVISPWIDRRQKIDIIRDELKERGIALFQQAGPQTELL